MDTPQRVIELEPSRRKAITAGLLVGTLLASMEATVVGAAMPSIVEAVGGLTLFPWVFTGYLLSQSFTIPLWGRLADLVGRRHTYLAGVLLFLIGSAACGAAPNMAFLIGARILQGLGAGCLLPLTMTIFGDLYPMDQRTRVQGLFSLVWGVSSVLGPMVGGAIVTHHSWRWIFLLNIPIGLVAAGMVMVFLPEPPATRKPKLDLAGAAVLSLSVISLLVGLLPPDQRPTAPWGWLVASIALAGLFLQMERRHPEPLIPLELFRIDVQRAVNVAGFLMGVSLLGLIGFMPLAMRTQFNASPFWAGMALVPISLTWTTASLLAGSALNYVGFRTLVRIGGVFVGVGLLVLWTGLVAQSLGILFLGMLGYGLGMGCCFSVFTVVAQETCPPEQRGIATALTQFFRNMGGTVGMAVLGSLMAMGIDPEVAACIDESGLTDPDINKALGVAVLDVFAAMAASGVTAGVLAIYLFPDLSERVKLHSPGNEQHSSTGVDPNA
ncbi:MAG: MFS transporter [Myxococcota bacterium]|nr:MFS transporter [Myxococcota bacterium]